MKLPALVRRRLVWFPTVWSLLLLLVATFAVSLLISRHLYDFLAVNEPVDAKLLVIEGWLSVDALDQAIAAYKRGVYTRVVTTGGPIEDEFEPTIAYFSYAERARSYLVRHGLPQPAVIAVPAPASAQDRTFLSAVMVREWAAKSGLVVDALDVFSLGIHSRRSRTLYQLAFGAPVRIGILAAHTREYDPDAWWRTSVGARDVITESIAWAWTELFFWPAPPGSHDEMWGPRNVSRAPGSRDPARAAAPDGPGR